MMARFLFRLDASLRIAEQALEAAQKVYAQEVQRWQVCVRACEVQQMCFNEAQEGQRDTARHRPEELGRWQIFAAEQQRRLRSCEVERMEQEPVVENARYCLLEAHREMEKFGRLKDKQAKAFLLTELQKEQMVLDETGQVLHWRQKKVT